MIEVQHHFSDEIYGKEFRIPAGWQVGKHVHEYSHLSVLAKGRVILTVGDEKKEYKAPACIEIKAGVQHVIDAVEDAAWFCIHATDERDISRIDQVLIQKRGM